jgi:putative inorganic carbon (HCO3(-)) transporter
MSSLPSLWQHLTLSTLPWQSWRQASYLHHLIGFLRNWRKGSRLMQWADGIGAGLAALVFALAPFVPNSLTGVLLAACGAFWLLLTLSDEISPPLPHSPTPPPLTTPIHLVVFLYWGVMSVAMAMSPVKRAAFSGWSKLTLYLLLFALLARVLRSPRLRSWLIGIYLHVALLVSTYGIHQRIFGAEALATWVDPTSLSAKEERVYSFLGNPNLLGGYLLPAIALSAVAFFVWRQWGPKLLALVMVGINSACLYYTGSRGAWIGFVALGLVLLFLLVYWWSRYLPRFWRTWALPLALAGFVGAVLLAVMVLEPLRDRVSSIFMGRDDSSNNFRMNVWAAVVDMIRDRPVLGIGPGNEAFNKIYPLFQRPRFSALSAYSIFLEVTVEAGIFGLSCFLWLLLITLTTGWNGLRSMQQTANRQGFWLIGAIAALVGMLGHGLVDTVLYRPEINTLWWLMIATISSYYSPAAEVSQSDGAMV